MERKAKCGTRTGYAKRGLPVSLEFMSPEVKIPIGNAVQLRKLRFAAVLVDGRLHLLERGKFQAVAQHIDARDSERTVRTHRISGRMRLCKQIVLLHDMSRKVNLILAAPRADIVGKRAGEPFQQYGRGIDIWPVKFCLPANPRLAQGSFP